MIETASALNWELILAATLAPDKVERGGGEEEEEEVASFQGYFCGNHTNVLIFSHFWHISSSLWASNSEQSPLVVVIVEAFVAYNSC